MCFFSRRNAQRIAPLFSSRCQNGPLWTSKFVAGPRPPAGELARRRLEAAKKLGKQAESLAPDQPWKKIRGLGNLLRHEYDTIRRDDLWAIVRRDLTSLHKACLDALASLERPDR